MCAIAGIYNLDGKAVDAAVIDKMLNDLRHRGPDDTGREFFNADSEIQPSLGFGHCRLKIIDLSSDAHQPMSNEDGSVWIVFNGMIYNYIELTAELKLKGHIFKSRSDTEVLIHAYEEFGEECFCRLNGIWSLALWDARRKVLLCSRDRLGVKPFYYFYDGSNFVFSSEIKALFNYPRINKKPNYRTIYNYLSYNFGYTDISDETFFDGIKQILPGENLIIKNSRLERKIYWDLSSMKRMESSQDNNRIDKFYEIFEDAVKIRLRSDVPLGISLSGGLDSSAVLCVANRLIAPKKIKTFTVSFDDASFNEVSYARQVADYVGAEAYFVHPKAENLFDDLTKLIWHQEEPFTNLNIYSQWLLMQEARRKGVTVILNGHGGDEALNGYSKEFYFFFADLIKTFKWPRLKKELFYHKMYAHKGSLISLTKATCLILSRSVPNFLKDYMRQHILTKNKYLHKNFIKMHENYFYLKNKFDNFLKSSSYMDYRISPLPGWLHAEDRISMAYAIESRSPFLDFRIAEFGMSLPPEQKFRDGVSKFILRRAMEGIMPESVRMRLDKMGYPTPTENWLKGSLHNRIKGILSSVQFADRGIFNPKKVLSAFNEHCQGRRNFRFAIWSWVNLELWFRSFFDNVKNQ